MVILGMSTSSLGVSSLREDPRHPLGTVLGEPQAVRSDEWLTQTPLELNVLALGHSSHSSLSESPDLVFQISSGHIFESMFFFESTILRLGPELPDAQLFAAMRALPVLLVLLTLPPLLRRFGANRPHSWLAVALILLAPTSLWWSFTPVRILAFGSLGSFLLVCARDRLIVPAGGVRRAIGWIQAAVGGVVVAHLATYYIPWCLTIGLPLVAATAAWLLWSDPRRPGFSVLVVGAAAGGGLLGLTLWENQDALRASFATVYPGSRRTGGGAVPPFQLFGAPGLFKSARHPGSATPNASEIASAFLICAVWAGLLATRLERAIAPAQRAAYAALWASLGLWLAWCTVSWGHLGGQIPILSLVPAPRAAQTVGYTAALVLCLSLARVRPAGRRRAGYDAAVCGLVTAYGVSDLQGSLSTLSTQDVWLSALAVATVVWLVSSFPTRWAPVGLVTVALVASGYAVNPLILGLGDLRDSTAARQVQRLRDAARHDRAWIASDSPMVSALLVANGAPSLTGYQVTGPDVAAWHHLDPNDLYKDNWNRGASFLRMSFAGRAGEGARVTNPNPDVIQVDVDPCTLATSGLDVRYLISGQALTQPCVVQQSTFVWSGQTQRIYSLKP